MAIDRAILTHVYKPFDFFNDYQDTYNWLGRFKNEPAAMVIRPQLQRRHKEWLRAMHERGKRNYEAQFKK